MLAVILKICAIWYCFFSVSHVKAIYQNIMADSPELDTESCDNFAFNLTFL